MPNKKLLYETFYELIKEITPQTLINKQCSLKDGVLNIQNSKFFLANYKNIYLFGSGKAVLPMAEALQDLLKNKIKKTLLVGAYKNSYDLKNTVYIKSSHPLPTHTSLKAAKKLKEELDNLKSDDFFIYLLSGGSSSLLELPQIGITLEEFQEITKVMLKGAMPIEKINCVRKHLSQIKGGKLVKNVNAKGIVLVLSDVLGDNLHDIGSAPLYFDTTTYKDAITYLKEYDIFTKIPLNIQKFLINKSKNEIIEKKKQKFQHFILGSNKIVLEKAKEILSKNIGTTIIKEPIKNEVDSEAKKLLDFARTHKNTRHCYLFGGECTVKVKISGKGGRNQHLVLGFLDKYDASFKVTFLSGATDGIDGQSDSAGACIDKNSKAKARLLDTEKYLKTFNSNIYFNKTDELLKIGATHNNLLDIVMMILDD
jgi:glycerate-2-kinase